MRELFPLRDGLWHRGRYADQQEEIQREATRDARGYGLHLFAKKRYEEAIPVLQWAIEKEPGASDLPIALGECLWQVSRWSEATPVFGRAVELNPRSNEAHLLYAEALMKLGKFTEAEHHFRRVANHQGFWNKLTARLTGRNKLPPLPPTVTPVDGDIYAKMAFCNARRSAIAGARKKIIVKQRPNIAWRRTERGRKMTVRNIPIIRPDSKVFTMGSCFALEIRHELSRRGFDVYPKYHEIDFDHASQILDSLPDRDNINHYDTFVIRQEVEMAFENRHFQQEDFWTVRESPINKVMGRETVYQDPYRKNIFASDPAGAADVSNKLGTAIREGLQKADVCVFTLGLIEAWQNVSNGRFICSCPGTGGGGGEAEAVLHVGTYQENYENMKRVCDLIFSADPDKHIILTVSPVALERTFRDMDIVIANMESKALLRAVAGQICREYKNVHYLPSFELFVYHDLHHDNGRHATRDGVEIVVDLFCKCFLAANAEDKDSAKIED